MCICVLRFLGRVVQLFLMRRCFIAFCAALLSNGAVAAPYTVQAFDTLFSIAKKFNVPVSEIKSANKLSNTALKTGQVVQIPERRHTVVKGETLFGVAKKYGSSVEVVAKLNKLKSNTVEIGQVLLIPWDVKTKALFKAPKPSTTSASKTSSSTKALTTKAPTKSSSTTKPPASKTLKQAATATGPTPSKTSSAAKANAMTKKPSSSQPTSSAAKPSATTKPSSGQPASSTATPKAATPPTIKPASSNASQPSTAPKPSTATAQKTETPKALPPSAAPKTPAMPVVVVIAVPPPPINESSSLPPPTRIVITTPSVTGATAPSFTISPSANLPQLPAPTRPPPTLPTGAGAARPRKLETVPTAPLPVFNQIPPITPLPEPILPTDPAPPSSSLEPSLTYTVISGDTLFSIARRYGITVDALRSNNGLSSDAIRVGQNLNINAPRAPDAPIVTNIRGISERYLGITYVYGGSSATGLDCSGFTVIVFNELGVKLPRVSRDQFNTGAPVNRDELLEGDLVFFDTTGQGVSHVGIYLSDGEFIHAASNPGKVTKSKLEEAYYAQRYLGARRVLGQD